MKLVVFLTSLTEEQNKWLRNYAFKNKKSKAQVIRELIDEKRVKDGQK